MGLLNNIATVVAPIAAGIVVSVASSEFSAWAPTWARRMVARAARHMPEAERTAAEAEWLAHIEQVPGSVAKVFHAFGLWRSAVVSRVTLKVFFRIFDLFSVPFIFVVAVTSTAIDYARGFPWAVLKLEIGPALASCFVMFFWVVGAVRHGRAQRRAEATSIPLPSVKR